MRRYYTAYENMRRKRHGFHKPKNELVTELLNKYRAEYDSHPDKNLTIDERYVKYLKHIDKVNISIDEKLENQDEVKGDDLSFRRSVNRMDEFYAWRKHAYLKTGPQNRHKKKAHSQKVFEKEYDHLASLEAFIKGIFYQRLKEDEDDYIHDRIVLDDRDEWLYGDGSYTEEEQYQRKIVQLSIGHDDKPKKNQGVTS